MFSKTFFQHHSSAAGLEQAGARCDCIMISVEGLEQKLNSCIAVHAADSRVGLDQSEAANVTQRGL